MHSDFQLGAWRVQPQLNSVACEQRTIRLEPKMMGVLVCLAQRSGDVVSKEQLVQEVWRDTFVTDDVLIRCVSELRKVFGDNAGRPAIIETIPKRGYRLLLPVVPIALARRPQGRLQPAFADSIAVLPFENGEADPEMEYLSDGIAETIINSLSRLQNLRVVPRTTTFRYKRKLLDPAQVGRELGVRIVLTGHVVQRSDRLIVGTELIDTTHNSQLWGRTYHRKVDDIVSIQSEIASEIPNYLRLRLTDVEKERLTKSSTENREAYHFFLKAMYFANKWTPEGFRKGLEFCRQAIDMDPLYAEAHAALGYLYTLMGTFDVVPAMEAFPRAKAAALKALEIDDSFSDAHALLGFVKLVHDWDWQNAEEEICRAIELGPHLAGGHYAYSHWLVAKGLHKEAIEEAKWALDLDPLSLPKNYHLGAAYFFARAYDAAVEQLKKTSELDPSFVIANNLLAVTYAVERMPIEAVAEVERARSLSDGLYSRRTLGRISAMMGKQAEAREILSEVERVSQPPYFSQAGWCAMIHALLGERDQAFEWLDRACAAREAAVIFVRQFPDFESLHGDSRFGDLLRRIGLAS
jgi:TolB-like protein